ncbi:CocE/NonD family hydrolase C-terminal non-catalytic domain-containing protein [Streptomyces sp. NPDC057367]|uniref:CocE/NonD family hydrolase C-terminal non-catalytic domain-containing protein n=1 Tax=Streptomyces sp. NPDC057367 TaxID=3346108 RepID=UPI003631ACB2
MTRFGQETKLVGHPKAHLWVEAKGSDDMDLFILVQKLDAYGTPLQQFTVPNQGALIQDVTERSASILRYEGSDGRRRVSMRHLDEKLSTEEIPATPSTGSRSSSPAKSSTSRWTCSPSGSPSTRASSSASSSEAARSWAR